MSQPLLPRQRRDSTREESFPIKLGITCRQLVRFHLSNLLVSDGERRLGLLGSDAGFYSRHHTQPLMPAARETRWGKRIEHGSHHQRHAHVWIVRQIQSVKSGRSHAEHCEWCFINEDRLVDDVGIFVESSFPERITQNPDRMCTTGAV